MKIKKTYQYIMDELKYEVVFLGSSNVGKTVLYNGMTNKTTPDVKGTINFDSSSIHVCHNGTPVEIQLWDTAGQEKYRSMTGFYTKKANGIFLVFDLSDLNASDTELDYINQQIYNAPEDVSILIIGNKIDLFPNNKPPYNPDLEKIKKNIKHFNYIETSALYNINVSEAFNLMIDHLVKQNIVNINPKPPELQATDKSNQGCC